MIAPAARAALMAMLSMGCSACDMGAVGVRRRRAAGRPERTRARCKMSDSHFSRRMPADPTRFVLVGTSHAGNVGAAARAMKVMGFSDLVLVAPRFADVLQRAEAHRDGERRDRRARAARASSPTLGEALDGVTCACATAMTPRDFGPPNRRRASCSRRSPPSGAPGRLRLRLGALRPRQRRRLRLPRLPDDPDRPGLRLAQPGPGGAADRLRLAPGAGRLRGRRRARRRRRCADAVAVRGLVAHWQEALEALGFLDPAAPKKLMPRLQRLANRAELTREEVHILRGIARAIDERCR